MNRYFRLRRAHAPAAAAVIPLSASADCHRKAAPSVVKAALHFHRERDDLERRRPS
jgi:hypothetical protein